MKHLLRVLCLGLVAFAAVPCVAQLDSWILLGDAPGALKITSNVTVAVR